MIEKNINVRVCAGHDDQSIRELCHPEDGGDGGGAAGGSVVGRGQEKCRQPEAIPTWQALHRRHREVPQCKWYGAIYMPC